MADHSAVAKQHHLPFGIFAWEEKLTVYSEPDGALSSANQTAGKNVLPPSPLRLISNMDCAEHHHGTDKNTYDEGHQTHDAGVQVP